MAGILNHSKVTADGADPHKWLLVLHGIYGSGRNWGTIARRLVEERPEWGVALVDLRMHGMSQGFEGPHTLKATADDVDAMVAETGLNAQAVLGHSFGGKVALVYAQRHGDELEQVWIIDSTLEVREPSGTAWKMIEVVRSLPSDFESRDEAVAGLVENGYSEGIARWMAMNLTPEDGRYRWRLDFDGVEQMLRDYFETDVWKVLENPPPNVDLHFIKAEDSHAITDDDVERIEAAKSEGAALHIHRLEGGHWINVDNPDGVLELLSRTL